MSKKTNIAFIIEGVKTEPQIIQNLQNHFFGKYNIVPIMLPACTNIYALFNRIKDDDYDTDIIEIVKELSQEQSSKAIKKIDKINTIDYRTMRRTDFSEIFLFFDYDGHNNNLPVGLDSNEVLKEMLKLFDNETEFGKMYISYPMIEAIKHFSCFELCNQKDKCIYDIEEGIQYKYAVSQMNLIQDIRKMTIAEWEFILKKFLINISCLFDLEKELTLAQYRNIYPKDIFNYQMVKYIMEYNKIMIISAIPEFILDYFKIDVLNQILSIDNIFSNIMYKKSCTQKDFVVYV
jgi:hypothetical protein